MTLLPMALALLLSRRVGYHSPPWLLDPNGKPASISLKPHEEPLSTLTLQLAFLTIDSQEGEEGWKAPGITGQTHSFLAQPLPQALCRAFGLGSSARG